mmetsp:Transcript_29776/g.33853  ORF Transcript_29776/g.33853 Transcript_29776/m.33853 type:complete len:241 (+) Transcript_29776:34-756(+)
MGQTQTRRFLAQFENPQKESFVRGPKNTQSELENRQSHSIYSMPTQESAAYSPSKRPNFSWKGRHLSVYCISHSRLLAVPIFSSITILEVKEICSEMIDVAIEDIELSHHQRPLDDFSFVRDLNLEGTDILKLTQHSAAETDDTSSDDDFREEVAVERTPRTKVDGLVKGLRFYSGSDINHPQEDEQSNGGNEGRLDSHRNEIKKLEFVERKSLGSDSCNSSFDSYTCSVVQDRSLVIKI